MPVKSHFSVKTIQKALRSEKIDGWLFYYFQKNDPIAEKVLGLDASHFFTRRWFYFIPAQGTPLKLVHRIEPGALDGLSGRAIPYLSWQELRAGLNSLLRGHRRVAMQYSPKNAVPYISRVDAGTVELVRSCGVAVVSSGDLVQSIEAVITPAQWKQHQKTAADLRAIVFEAFRFIRQRILAGRSVGEFDVQKKILAAYSRRGLISNSPPIVAVNHNSASPHYVPGPGRSLPIRRGDWVLLDIWAKPEGTDAVYADITWCGFVGETVPEKFEKIFQIVRSGRDAALDLVRQSAATGKPLLGRDVDRAARGYIAKQGYGDYFIHRTGHSIGLEDHANGANMDSLETDETRRLIPSTLFSIEPGIYLKGFGARSEIDVYFRGSRVDVSGAPIQENVVPILRE